MDGGGRQRGGRGTAVVFLLLLTLVAGVFSLAPGGGHFWWSDAPRHALNGAFILDFVKEPSNPLTFAYDYYRRLPALSIGFYPPLYHLVEAGFFALFGVSHGSALATSAFFYFLAGWAAFLFSRRFLPLAWALAVALLFMLLPENLFWGRRVMIDLPAVGLLILSAHCLLGHGESRRPASLYGAILFFVAALYTKQTVAFFALVILGGLWRIHGRGVWRYGHAWWGLGVFTVLMVPLLVMTGQLGGFHAVSVVKGATAAAPPVNWAVGVGGVVVLLGVWRVGGLPWLVGLFPLAVITATAFVPWLLPPLQGYGTASKPLNFLFYAQSWPRQLGWGGAFAFGFAFLLFLRERREGALLRLLLVVWLVAGYLFFSFISLKSIRFSMPLLFPAAFLVMWGIWRFLPGRVVWAVVVLLATGWQGLFQHGMPHVTGYREAAQYAVEHAPVGSSILFSGERDGAFIFNLRALEGDKRLRVIRADKLFFDVAVSRQYGMREINAMGVSELSDFLLKSRVFLVVSDPTFWSDAAPMRRLREVLASDDFAEVGRIPVGSVAMAPQEPELVIHENRRFHLAPERSIPLPPIRVPLVNHVIPGRQDGRPLK